MTDFKCSYCKKEFKNSNSCKNHERRCSYNPNKINIIWDDKARKKHSEIMKVKNNNKNRVWDEQTLKKISSFQIERNKKYWTKENREKHSNIMRQVVENNPKSYSTSKILKRHKKVKSIDSYGNTSVIDGGWELLFVNWLNESNIKWLHSPEKFEYKFENKNYIYFPDFYLPDYDLWVEVKGYQRDKDFFKWQALIENHKKKLVVLKQNDIIQISKSNFDINSLLLKINNINN